MGFINNLCGIGIECLMSFYHLKLNKPINYTIVISQDANTPDCLIANDNLPMRG